MISRQRLGELARYGVTGAVCASLNVGIAVFLTDYMGLHYLLSLTLCSAIVIVTGFFLNRSWTFRKNGESVLAEFLRYSTVMGMNVIIGLLACALLVEAVHLRYAYAIAIVAVVFAPTTYVIHRIWTFGLSWLHAK